MSIGRSAVVAASLMAAFLAHAQSEPTSLFGIALTQSGADIPVCPFVPNTLHFHGEKLCEYIISPKAMALVDILHRKREKKDELRELVNRAAPAAVLEIDWNSKTNAWKINRLDRDKGHGRAGHG